MVLNERLLINNIVENILEFCVIFNFSIRSFKIYRMTSQYLHPRVVNEQLHYRPAAVDMTSNLTKLSNLKRTPMPGPRGHKDKDLKSCVTESEMKAILINNPKVFDSFVLECVSQERLENLLSAKKQRPVVPGISHYSIRITATACRKSQKH